MKIEKPDLSQPKTLILPLAGTLLLILILCLTFCRSKEGDRRSGNHSTTPAFPVSKLDKDEVQIELRRFTHWMTPEEIDAHIRILGGTSEEGFWDQGHWIVAAEGRWHNGVHQFRIAYDKSPPKGEFSWQYKINQTQADFSKSIDQFLKAGYTLIHSQSFKRPDDTTRYQGVWHQVNEAALPGKENAYEKGAAKTEPKVTNDPAAPSFQSKPVPVETKEPLSKFNKQDFRESSGN